MKQVLLILGAGLALSGCVTPYGWSEAPMDDRYYDHGAPVAWWGQNAASIDVFYSALSGYGRWLPYGSYGRVFVPSGIGNDWQPYSRGYWRNDSRLGRLWVSSEPFGWATYHYGRWGFDTGIGWFWVPDTRFGPGWVDWQNEGSYATWAPLPPSNWGAYGHAITDFWWVSAPSSWAYRPGMHEHVRPGRPSHWQQGRPPVARPDQSRPNPSRPDQSRPNPSRPDDGKPGAVKPDQGRPDQGRPDQGRPGAGRPDQGRPDQGRPDAGRPDQGRPDQNRPDQGRPPQVDRDVNDVAGRFVRERVERENPEAVQSGNRQPQARPSTPVNAGREVRPAQQAKPAKQVKPARQTRPQKAPASQPAKRSSPERSQEKPASNR